MNTPSEHLIALPPSIKRRFPHSLRLPKLRMKYMLFVLLGAFSLQAKAAGTFVLLGDQGSGVWSHAVAMSADASFVVGDVGDLAFRWTEAGGMLGLGTFGSYVSSYAYGVSGDGAVVVGYGSDGITNEAFRWTQATGMVGLGFLPNKNNSYAYAVSADGKVIVGSGFDGGTNEAFRWTATEGMLSLGFVGTDVDSTAYAVSADGSVVVGYSGGGGGIAAPVNAFRWTAAGGMVSLGALTTDGASSAYGVSADGSVVVGDSFNGLGDEAFRWTQETGMVGLGVLAGAINSYANGVSADGRVVVGFSSNGVKDVAFRWTQETGIQSVATWLSKAGVAVPTGLQLYDALATNADGSVVVGSATDTTGADQAWLARVSPLGSGIISNLAAFNNTLLETGVGAVQAGVVMPNLTLFGAHHRSLLDSGLVRTQDSACAWATADAIRSNDMRMQLSEAGACKDVDTSRLGVGLGQVAAQQNWSLDGAANYSGQYLLLEADTAFANGIETGVLAYYGRFNTELRRNYINGNTLDTSTGKPEANSTALRTRVKWKDAQIGNFSIATALAYTWIQAKIAPYAESGGNFAASYDAARWHSNELRVGMTGKTALADTTWLRLAGDAVNRLDDSSNGVHGRVAGLWDFTLNGQSGKRSWKEFAADIDHQLSDTALFTIGLKTSSYSGDPWGFTAGYRTSF